MRTKRVRRPMRNVPDPCLDEILATLRSVPTTAGYSKDDMYRAAYWFAHDFHAGPGTNLYAAFREVSGTCWSASARAADGILYDLLVDHFA